MPSSGSKKLSYSHIQCSLSWDVMIFNAFKALSSPKTVEFSHAFQAHFNLNKGLAGTFSDCGGLIVHIIGFNI